MGTAVKKNSTGAIIAKMLKENTGRHMLDSGGAYGRNWERNQEADFEAMPPATIDAEGSLEINVYHWLKDRLDYSKVIDTFFYNWAKRGDGHYLALMEEFVSEDGPLARMGFNVGGVYGDGKPFTVNSYNEESALSQVIQYTCGWIKGEKIAGREYRSGSVQEEIAANIGAAFVLLQIHGGCDVRGGYTRPRFFWLNDDSGLFDHARGTCQCSKCGARWDTDNAGYAWQGVESDYPDTPQLELPQVQKPGYFVPDDLNSESWGPYEKDKVITCPHCKAEGTITAHY